MRFLNYSDARGCGLNCNERVFFKCFTTIYLDPDLLPKVEQEICTDISGIERNIVINLSASTSGS